MRRITPSFVLALLLLAGLVVGPAQAEDPIRIIGGSVTPAVITAGDIAYVTVEISEPAPPGTHGLQVRMSPANAWNRVPAPLLGPTGLVDIPVGETSVTFPVWMATFTVTEPQTVPFTGQLIGEPAAPVAELTILPADPDERAVVAMEGPTGVLAGTTVEPEVVLNTAAPDDGLAMVVFGNTAYTGGFSAPNHVFIPGGSDRGAHPMRAGSVPHPRVVRTTADLGTSRASWETVISPPEFSIHGGWVWRGETVRRGVGLGGVENPDGATVQLTTDVPGITVPASVTVPPGSVGVAFDLEVAPWVQADRATISATWEGQSASHELVINGAIRDEP